MVETRPEMTRAEFDAAASYAPEGRWLTGWEHFVHVSAVTKVEGWNLYGHLGRNRLTEPQRVLMMWSDLVGQTANGGFEQFACNYENVLELAYGYVAELGWPELFERFDLAFREQAGDPGRPALRREEWRGGEDWPTRRARIVAHLALKATRWRPWARRAEEAAYASLTDTIGNTFFNRAVEAGTIDPGAQPVLVVEGPPTEAADAFDDWFYRDATKAASRTFVGDHIRRYRNDLCRLSE